MDIPRDKTYPLDAGQCDECGGLGSNYKVGDCPVCEGKGWLPAGHPRIRICENPECDDYLRPWWIPVYCSNDCAFEDARPV
jgi:hypothetical protein